MLKLSSLCLVTVGVLALWMTLSVHADSTAEPHIITKTVYNIEYSKNPDTGKIEEREIPEQKTFQIIQQKTQMTDPNDPSKEITVEVPVEVEYNPNRKVNSKLKKLKKKLAKLKKRENQLRGEYHIAKSRRVDFPVVEDGAPAPPDPQLQAIAQELYGELEATRLPLAKTIRQDDLDNARQFILATDGNREAYWKMFNKMSEEMLVPSHAWGSTM